MRTKASIHVLILLASMTAFTSQAEANRLTDGLLALWNKLKPAATKNADPVTPKAPAKVSPTVAAAETAQSVKAVSLKRVTGYLEDGLNNKTNNLLKNTYGRVQSTNYGETFGIDEGVEKLTLALIGSSDEVQGAVVSGAQGVGKSQYAYRLQEKIQQGKVPPDLLHGQVIGIDMAHPSVTDEATLLAALDKIEAPKFANGTVSKGPVILHFERTEGLLSRDGEQFNDDIDKLILLAKRKFAGQREVKFIVEVTSKDLSIVKKKNPFLNKNFTFIHVAQVSNSQVVKIVRQYAKGIAEDNKTIITDDVIYKAIDLAKRYYADMAPPSSVIRLLDKAAGAKRITNADPELLTRKLQDEVEELQEQLARARTLRGRNARRLVNQLPVEIKAKQQAIAKMMAEHKVIEDAQATQAAILSKYGVKNGAEMTDAQLAKIKMKPADATAFIAATQRANTVQESDIARVINRERGVAIEAVMGKTTLTFDNVVAAMKKRVIGQDHAVERLAALAMRAFNPDKPAGTKALGVAWLTGPPGSGKTSGAYAIADIAFKGKIVRVDMGEFKEGHSISKITSTSPGYTGYGDGNTVIDQLIKECSDQPCVLLLDEVEEAHRNAVNIWVAAMGDGTMASGEGKKFDFRNVLILATTNSVDNVPVTTSLEQMKILLGKAMDLPPKILNRIDDVIPYNALNMETSQHILSKLIDDFNNNMAEKMIRLKVMDGARTHMALIFQQEMKRAAGNLDKSARDINRVFQRFIADPIVSIRTSQKYKTSLGRQVEMSVTDGDLIVMRRTFVDGKPEIIFEVMK
jgi:ATP-dependent Clp protease ATP-binding subunit ClpB